jgi:hypothetical protein
LPLVATALLHKRSILLGRRRAGEQHVVAFTAVPAHVAECRLPEFRLAPQIVQRKTIEPIRIIAVMVRRKWL